MLSCQIGISERILKQDKLGAMDDLAANYDAQQEPEFDVPPVFADADERRMHVRAYNYWASLLRGREFPAIQDLNPEEIDDFGPNSVLLDFTDDRESPKLRFIGDILREECGIGEGEVDFDDIPSRSLLSRLTDHFFEIIANRAPIGFEAEFTSRRGHNTMYRGILMPLSADGSTIDFIYGVINWKELVEPEIEADIISSAVNFAHAPPAGATAEAILFAEDEEGEAPGQGAELGDFVHFARASADRLAAANERSRVALYRALSAAYNVHLAALGDERGYAELLVDQGIKVQARAPMTAVVKLVFGADYDKARVTEFSAALAFAARQEVGFGAFADFVAGFDGGLKALVKSEREARRTETDAPRVDRAAAKREKLRAAAALAAVSIDIPGDDEFVLLVARREAAGRLEVVGAVRQDEKLVDRALRRLD